MEANARSKSTPRFWDKTAAKYARQPVADEAAYQKKLEITRQYFRPDMEVMEFGCGTGSTALAHAPHVRHILATDFSGEMIAIAQEKAKAAGIENVTFRQTGIEEFDAPDGSYDAILALSILHLLEDRKAALAKVRRLLKPDGVFVSSTACVADMMPLFRYIAPGGRLLGLIPYVDIFTRESLLKDFSATGFKIDYEWQPDKKKAVFIIAK